MLLCIILANKVGNLYSLIQNLLPLCRVPIPLSPAKDLVLHFKDRFAFVGTDDPLLAIRNLTQADLAAALAAWHDGDSRYCDFRRLICNNIPVSM
jgi:hypothetical protein